MSTSHLTKAGIVPSYYGMSNWGRDDWVNFGIFVSNIITMVGVALNSTILGAVGGVGLVVFVTLWMVMLGGWCSCHAH